MIIVRFKETFRERSAEWAMATGLFLWGMMTLASPGLFMGKPYFIPLLAIMSQFKWGIITIFTGIIRLIFLVINGAWRPSAHIRAIGSVFGSVLWGALLISALNLGWLTPTTAIYSVLLSLDLLSIWFAAGDAKLADLSAKKRV